MNKELWKSLTTQQKVFYALHICFSYGGTLGITLWTFLIEKLISHETTIWTKLGCSGICCLVLLGLFAVIFWKRHTNKVLETNRTQQDKIMKDMLMETDTAKKEDMRLKLIELENYEIKVKTNKTIFKNALLCAVFVALTLLFFLVEKEAIEMRGIFFGITACLLTGFGFDTAYEKLTEKLNIKK